MSQKRRNVYEKLVNTMLTFPNNIVAILQENQEFLDAGLVKTMFTAIEMMAHRGDWNAANWLHNVAQKIALSINKPLEAIMIEAEADFLYWQGAEQQQQTNQHQASLDIFQRAIKIYRQTRNCFKEGDALVCLGIAYDFTGNYQKAIDCYQQSLDIAQKIKSSELQSMCFGNLAKTYCHIGEYDKALEHEETCLSIARKLGNNQATVTALGGLGSVLYYLGEYKKAIDIHKQQLNLAREINMQIEEMNALGSLGLLLHIIGQDEQAIHYYQQCLKIAEEIGTYAEYAATLSNIGAIYNHLGKFDKAIDNHEQSLKIRRKIGHRDGEADSLSGLGMVYRSLGKYHQAIEYYQQALNITREIGSRAGVVYDLGNLCFLYTVLHQYQQAVEYGQQAVNIAREIKDLRGEGFALDNLGFALLNYGYVNPAENILRDAIKAKELLRTGLEDAHNISLFNIQTNTYSLLQQALLIQYKFQEALEIAERGRTRAFVELLYQRLSINLDRTIDEFPVKYAAEAFTHEKIQEIAQKQNVTLVEYSIPNLEYLFIWVVKPNGEIIFRSFYLKHLREKENIVLLDLVNSAREFLDIQNLHKEIISNNSLDVIQATKNISQPLQRLYQLLIEPIAEFLPQNIEFSVIFIPQGDLFLIPFPALQDSEGKFLIEKHTIATVPSIQILELTQKQSTNVQKIDIDLEALVVGNPKMPAIPLTEPPVKLKDLAWAKTEANAIAPLLNIQAITGADATKAYITQLLPKARLIHLATHGLLDDIRQLGIPGAIALAPSDEDNGFLTAGEIYNMKLNAELVVLSACSTGLGKITGDGVIGLSRCLMAAGVKSVIVSLWSVGDLSTALLMVKFYQIFEQGVAATIALNEAQRWLLGITKRELSVWIKTNERFFDATLKINLRRRLHKLDDNGKLFKHPRYWAAFCAIGQ